MESRDPFSIHSNSVLGELLLVTQVPRNGNVPSSLSVRQVGRAQISVRAEEQLYRIRPQDPIPLSPGILNEQWLIEDVQQGG